MYIQRIYGIVACMEKRTNKKYLYDETVSWFPATKSKSAKLILKNEKKIFLSFVINLTFQQEEEQQKLISNRILHWVKNNNKNIRYIQNKS